MLWNFNGDAWYDTLNLAFVEGGRAKPRRTHNKQKIIRTRSSAIMLIHAVSKEYYKGAILHHRVISDFLFFCLNTKPLQQQRPTKTRVRVLHVWCPSHWIMCIFSLVLRKKNLLWYRALIGCSILSAISDRLSWQTVDARLVTFIKLLFYQYALCFVMITKLVFKQCVMCRHRSTGSARWSALAE